jgi:hypothetical protein
VSILTWLQFGILPTKVAAMRSACEVVQVLFPVTSPIATDKYEKEVYIPSLCLDKCFSLVIVLGVIITIYRVYHLSFDELGESYF